MLRVSQAAHPVEIPPGQIGRVHHGRVRPADDDLAGAGNPPYLVRSQQLPCHKTDAVGAAGIDIPAVLTG